MVPVGEDGKPSASPPPSAQVVDGFPTFRAILFSVLQKAFAELPSKACAGVAGAGAAGGSGFTSNNVTDYDSDDEAAIARDARWTHLAMFLSHLYTMHCIGESVIHTLVSMALEACLVPDTSVESTADAVYTVHLADAVLIDALCCQLLMIGA